MKKATAIIIVAFLGFQALQAQNPYTDRFENGDPIPDFSRVGYHWGDRDIPDVPVVMTLTAPKDGADATQMIQDALDGAKAPGAVLLKAGEYRVSGALNLTRSGIVLRGEGEGTKILATGTQKRVIVTVGSKFTFVEDKESIVELTERVPVGQLWLPLGASSGFAEGDRILVEWQPDEQWIKDLKMDQISARGDGGKVSQWSARGFRMRWERTVVKVEKKRIWLDNPIVMEMGAGYGKAFVKKCSAERICESGVEDIYFESEYDHSIKDDKGHCTDENHATDAVVFHAAEHCWARGITDRYFVHGCVTLSTGAKNITVRGCRSHEPVSVISGGRRYAYCFDNAQLCLYEDCRCDADRHQFASGSRTSGPNVFVDCKAEGSFADAGPHHRWATGILYDNVSTDKDLCVQDRGSAGSGQGWAGANFVFWNCEAGSRIVCQSPWVSAKNYAIGCIGPKKESTFKGITGRPDGVWEHYGEKVSPVSLYRYQLEKRHNEKIYIDK